MSILLACWVQSPFALHLAATTMSRLISAESPTKPPVAAISSQQRAELRISLAPPPLTLPYCSLGFLGFLGSLGAAQHRVARSPALCAVIFSFEGSLWRNLTDS